MHTPIRNTSPIVDALITAVVVLDDQLNITLINSAAQALLQTSETQALGQSLTSLIVSADQIVPLLESALATNQPFTERDATIRLPDNVSQHVDFTVTVIEPNPEGAALLIELQPLNRLQQINRDDESVARQETTRRLIRGLAHEVKNPLGGIRGAAQLLERQLKDAEQTEYTDVIIAEADRLKELVDRMLGPQQQLAMSDFNILQVFEHIIRVIEAEAPDQYRWVRDYDPSIPELIGDEAQIVQAILNVIRNACEALRETEDPRIELRSRVVRQFTIGTTVHRQVMRLDITDNGPGIAPELLERIFFPMISGRPEGSGLGLAITQNIIAQHGGSIQVSSTPGQTTFTIHLPLAPLTPLTNPTDYAQEART